MSDPQLLSEKQHLQSEFAQESEHAKNAFSLTPSLKSIAINQLEVFKQGHKKIERGTQMLGKKPFPLLYICLTIIALGFFALVGLDKNLDVALGVFFSNEYNLLACVIIVLGLLAVFYFWRKRA